MRLRHRATHRGIGNFFQRQGGIELKQRINRMSVYAQGIRRQSTLVGKMIEVLLHQRAPWIVIGRRHDGHD